MSEILNYVVKPTAEQDLSRYQAQYVKFSLSAVFCRNSFSLQIRREYLAVNYYSWMAFRQVEKGRKTTDLLIDCVIFMGKNDASQLLEDSGQYNQLEENGLEVIPK